MAAAPAAADVFTVRGVEVDETAGSAAEARETAIGAGQMIAARRLIERLTLEEDRATVPPLDPGVVGRLVAGFQVEEEAVSGSRYIGRLSVSFDPEAVRSMLETYAVPYVLSTAQPAVIVPLWRDSAGGGDRLWDDNPWLEAWSVAGTADELVPVLVPSGDLGDISALDAASAVALNYGALQRLAANYGSAHVLVALASPSGAEGTITARMVGIDFAHGGERKDYGSLGVGAPVDLARAAAAQLQDSWKRTLVVRDPYLTEASVSVLFNSVDTWMQLQKVISSEPLVQVARLDALTNDGAVMTLRHRGRPEQLQLALSEHGAQLDQTSDGRWTITRRVDAMGLPGQ